MAEAMAGGAGARTSLAEAPEVAHGHGRAARAAGAGVNAPQPACFPKSPGHQPENHQNQN